MARDNARPVPWWRWCACVLLAVCALAVLIVGVANVVTVATTRDRVVTVEGAATALAGDAADAVVVLGASVYADGSLYDTGINVHYTDGGVRPAMWVLLHE